MELVYSLEEIAAAASWLWRVAGSATVLAFEGEMGSGKTTLIQAVCRQLGVQGAMGSPTFSIINEYALPGGSVFHIDLYRCQTAEEAIRAGVEECFYSGSPSLVEWPSRAPVIFPDDTVWLRLVQLNERTRKIFVNCSE